MPVYMFMFQKLSIPLSLRSPARLNALAKTTGEEVEKKNKNKNMHKDQQHAR